MLFAGYGSQYILGPTAQMPLITIESSVNLPVILHHLVNGPHTFHKKTAVGSAFPAIALNHIDMLEIIVSLRRIYSITLPFPALPFSTKANKNRPQARDDRSRCHPYWLKNQPTHVPISGETGSPTGPYDGSSCCSGAHSSPV